MRVDLNADVGEGSGQDPALIRLVTSVNVACGAHAGDDETIRRTISLAADAGAGVGAHPGYPDREGFGRRRLPIRPDALRASLIEQVERLFDAARSAGVSLGHVKPHGALYNEAAHDRALAGLVASAVRDVSPALALVGAANSALLAAGESVGLTVVPEGFADRAYEADGRLRSRALPGALLRDPAAAARQAVGIVKHGAVRTADGTMISIAVRTLCIHGDTPGAEAIALAVREALEREGVAIRGFHDLRP